MLDEHIISRMAERIVKEVAPSKIILFGSHARGQATTGSDVDLLVIGKAPFGPKRSRFRETSRINRALADFGVAKDILVYSADEVAQWRDTKNHIIAHALREGKVPYDRP